MRFRRDKRDGGGGETPTEVMAAPPSASERVEEPPGSPAEAVDPRTADTPPRGNPVLDAPSRSPEAASPESPQSPTPDAESPQSPSPESPQSPTPQPGGPEPAKVLADPAPAGAGGVAPPPSAAARVDSPAPSPAARVESPPPPAAARVDTPGALAAAAPPQAGAIASAAPPPQPGALVSASPPPQPGQLVSAAPPAGAAIACPQCGSAAEPGQEMCIVCGSRIASAPAAEGSRGWRLPAVLAGLGVLLLGVAIAFGVVELTSDDDVKKGDVADLSPSTTTPPAAQPPPTTTPPPTPTTPTTPTTPGTIPPATREPQPGDSNAQPDDTPSTPDAGGPAEWPKGKTAYTVVLVSATSRNAADAKAEQAVKRGIDAGVLRSDDFSSLRPGFWVVFAGQFDSSEEATRAADRYAEQGFGGGYPRQVKPK
ncbi:MAG TPA: SPOR domain-containing protein [Thermoleophilaceae bacterium]|jgi:hypothetical protein